MLWSLEGRLSNMLWFGTSRVLSINQSERPIVAELLLGKVRNEKRKRKKRPWKVNSLQRLSTEYDIRIGLHEEECLETLTECWQWLSWRIVSSGSKFQMRGPATVKARLLTVESLTGGTRRRLVLAEHSVRRPGRSLTSASGHRYRCISCTGTVVAVDQNVGSKTVIQFS